MPRSGRLGEPNEDPTMKPRQLCCISPIIQTPTALHKTMSLCASSRRKQDLHQVFRNGSIGFTSSHPPNLCNADKLHQARSSITHFCLSEFMAPREGCQTHSPMISSSGRTLKFQGTTGLLGLQQDIGVNAACVIESFDSRPLDVQDAEKLQTFWCKPQIVQITDS